MYRVEEFTNEDQICFSHIVTPQEAKTIKTVVERVLTEHRGPTTSVPWVKTQLSQLSQLQSNLTSFFATHQGSFFLRLSTISPKDAYYQLYLETPEEKDIVDSKPTLDQINRDLSVLKVNSAEQSLLVLCHSERVMRDVELPNQAILLLKWKTLLTDTETRCFVKAGKLIAVSQYWADLSNGYASLKGFNPKTFLDQVKSFMFELKIPYFDAVVDLAVQSNFQLILIEMNPYGSDTDSSLFEWDELVELEQVKFKFPIFRFTRDDKVCEIV